MLTMLNRFISITYCFISILLLQIAPIAYDQSFCKLQMIVYILFALYFNYVMIKNANVVNFFIFYSIAFLFVTFVHSAFYVWNDDIVHAFVLGYDLDNINKSVSLAQLGNSAFCLSLFWSIRPNNFVYSFRISERAIKNYYKLAVFCVLLYDIYVLLLLKRVNAYTLFYPKLSLLILSVVIFLGVITFFNSNSQKYLVKSYFIKYLVLVFLFILPYLLLNSRTNLIAIMLFILFCINTKLYKIKLYQLLMILPIALLLMCIVMITRISSVNTSNSSFIEVFLYGIENIGEIGDINQTLLFVTTDLVANAKNLYDSITYVNGNGPIYGLTYLTFIFSWFPGLSSFIFDQLGMNVDSVNTSVILTGFNLADWGLGTHIIGDLYINGKIFAICLGMLLMGYIVRIGLNGRSLICLFIYISLLCNALILPRACGFSFLEIFYMFMWQYFIFRYFKHIKL